METIREFKSKNKKIPKPEIINTTEMTDESSDKSTAVATAQQNDGGGTDSQGRTRVIWTDELDQIFMVALHKLGDKAVPTTLLEELTKLGVEGLTRENVASHLQKFRQKLRVARDVTENPAAVVAKTLTPKAITKNKLKLEAFEKTAGLMNELGDAFTVKGAAVKRRRFGDHDLGGAHSSGDSGSTRISASNSMEVVGAEPIIREPISACVSAPSVLCFNPVLSSSTGSSSGGNQAPITKSSSVSSGDDHVRFSNRAIIQPDPSFSHVPITPSQSLSGMIGGAAVTTTTTTITTTTTTSNVGAHSLQNNDNECEEISQRKFLAFHFRGLGANPNSLAGFRWGRNLTTA